MSEALMTRLRYLGRGVVALALALFVAQIIRLAPSCQSLRPVRYGQVAPAFTLPSITASAGIGPTTTLAHLQGSIVVLDFWATWCGPCQSSLPVLEELSQRYQSQGVRFLSINTEGSGRRRAARTMIDELAPSMELLVDSGEVSRLYKLSTIPQIVLVDRQGRVAWVERGYRGASHLRSELDERIRSLLSP